MAVLPDHGRGHSLSVQSIFDGTRFGGCVAKSIVEQEDVPILEDPHRVLAAKAAERVVHDGELIMTTAKSPNDLAGDAVDLCDFPKIAERHDVIAVLVKNECVGMVKIDVGNDGRWQWGLDPVFDLEMVPGAPQKNY